VEAADRERIRAVFDRAAATYQEARPDYPDAVFEHILTMTGLQPGARLLEIGCATGKATLPFARRGFRITAVELGPALFEQAQANLAAFRAVDVVLGAFETTPLPAASFDLVYAATAWQWIDPTVRYVRAAEALRPGGHLAFWDARDVVPPGGDPFFFEIQEVYKDIGEGLPADFVWPVPGSLPEHTDEIEASGRFEVMDVRHFDWEVCYDAAGYLALLDTFSGHLLMEQWQRDRLYGEIRRRLAERPDGLVRRHWGLALHIARRLS